MTDVSINVTNYMHHVYGNVNNRCNVCDRYSYLLQWVHIYNVFNLIINVIYAYCFWCWHLLFKKENNNSNNCFVIYLFVKLSPKKWCFLCYDITAASESIDWKCQAG